ncbi:helix-turn-helix domain-containing protein [Flavobacterium sp. HXWNR29]|jgi:transcriptional regulator with XRE-family HTH domain|uniref:helix-turn-helix domain-containing protein n=1 Tax=Flavobacterium odoriferum TaxID=2946604 RepID=UPI0021CB5C69|nr:helix-turn-helix transcriptional regulator [Flavobacterium sp. HXWNR29]MCU4187961.1 helix-turn-helix domain-containing protein [Flavobacterium sp. HXWNR29]
MSSKKNQMETVGQIIRTRRENLGLLLRQVSAYVDIDQAILSKIERNERKPSKDLILKIAEILQLDKEELLVQFMSDKIAYEIADEDCASRVLKVAEEKIEYIKSHPIKI